MRSARRQVAAENGQVGRSPRTNCIVPDQGETDWATVAPLQYWGPDTFTDTLPVPGVFEYRLIGVNNGGLGTPNDIGTVNAV